MIKLFEILFGKVETDKDTDSFKDTDSLKTVFLQTGDILIGTGKNNTSYAKNMKLVPETSLFEKLKMEKSIKDNCETELKTNGTANESKNSTQIRKIEEIEKADEHGPLSDIDQNNFESSRNKTQENFENSVLKYRNILRGQRLKLAEVVPDSSKFEIVSNISGSGLIIDFACFGLDLNGQLSDSLYMISSKQSSTPCGGVSIDPLENNIAKFTVDLGKLSNKIHQLIFVAAVNGNAVMSQLASGHIKFILDGNEIARFSFVGSDFSEERALILLSIYLKQNVWRTSAIGQGFHGGLEQLVHDFGGTMV